MEMIEPQNPDKAREGLGWTVATAGFGFLAVVTQNPLAKLVLLLGAVATVGRAVDCFQTAALDAHQQLQWSKHPRLPPP